MKLPAARLGLFAVGLAVIFGTAAALGAVVHPGQPAASCASMHGGAMGHEALGTSVAQDDTTITPTSSRTVVGAERRFRFQILDKDGMPIRSGYQVEAERPLHLIAVRRDMTGYQHLHPTLGLDGTWSVPLSVAKPGQYRVFADFQLRCEKHVLAADLIAPGNFQPVDLPAPSLSARTDGYDLQLETPALHAGQEAPLRFLISRQGRPVRTIEPYLGARGHLVALRQGDLAYLHVHPEDHQDGDAANGVRFAADFPSPGAYRMFLQFKANGVVHTAAYTVEVAP
jgi:hypothetical protein